MAEFLKQIPNKIKYEKYTLSNGLPVILIPEKDLLSCHCNLYVRTGTQYETKENNGISHFLEHLLFKGTKQKPTNFDLTKPLDEIGANYNAMTGYEFTSFYVNAGYQFIETAINFLSDVYQNSIFPEAEFQKEKGVILEEIKMYQDNPMTDIEDIFNRVVYGDQPAGWNIAGTEKNIQHLKREDIIKYYKTYYCARNSFLVISGNFEKKKTKQLVDKYFSNANSGQLYPYPKTKIVRGKPKFIYQQRKTQETHFILGFQTFPYGNRHLYTIDTIDSILSGGFTSRLFQLVREKLGGAYYIHSASYSCFDRGLFIVKGGIKQDQSTLIIKEILREIKSLKQNKVSKEELQKAKNYLLGFQTRNLDQPYSLVHYVIESAMYQKPIETPYQKMKAIFQTTPQDILKIANKIFTKDNINLAIISNLKNKNAFAKLVKNI